MSHKIKAIIFDWDGTVVNTMQLKFQNLGIVFAKILGANPTDVMKSYRMYSGIPRRELFDHIAQDTIGRNISDFEFNRLSASFTDTNIQSYKENDVFDSQTEETLKWLMNEGFTLFVSSSAIPFEIKELAKHLSIDGYFKEILGSKNDFKKGKSHISYIMEKYGYASSQLLFVGDEKADMRLSGRLGVQCAGIARDKDHKELADEFADFTLQDFQDLKGVLTHV